MSLPSNDQVSAALRHLYTSAGTVLGMGAALALIPQDQVQPSLDALREVGDGIQKVFGGVSKLLIIVGPLVGVWMAKIAAVRSGLSSQVSSLFSKASAPENVELKKEVLAATAELPGVEKVVAPDVAAEVASEKVTSA